MPNEARGCFEMKGNTDLNMIHLDQDLFDINARLLVGLSGILFEEKVSIILGNSDTAS